MRTLYMLRAHFVELIERTASKTNLRQNYNQLMIAYPNQKKSSADARDLCNANTIICLARERTKNEKASLYATILVFVFQTSLKIIQLCNG